MTPLKLLGYVLMFAFGLLVAALGAFLTTNSTWGDIGVAIAFAIFIAPPISALLSLYVAFKLLPRGDFPRPLTFLISSAVLGAVLGPTVILVLGWVV